MFWNKSQKGKVYVGLSGGVDSAVSAALLKREGYEVVGVFIRIAIEGYPCPAAEDRIEAMRVAAHLKIPFIEIDLSKEYQERVFAYAVKEFERGRTPNPDALCNKEIKFGIFYDFARKSGADYVATGHYARLIKDELYVSIDDTKDQSYFLWAVPKTHLEHALFPVGGLRKSQVRRLAKKFGLPNNARPDSQGLCFLGDISITDMLMRETHPQPGEVCLETGEVIGNHKGVELYTLGQRHGFELKNQNSDVEPHYVIAKNLDTNTLIVSTSKFPKNASRTKLSLHDTNWIGKVSPGLYKARFRYRQQLVSCTLSENLNEVILHEPHYVPEGQSLVLYNGDRCLGGGIINSASVFA